MQGNGFRNETLN